MTAQTIKFPLSAVTWSANGRAQVDFNGVPTQLGGRICHATSIGFDVQATPTLSSGTATPEELQAAVRSVQVRDGVLERFSGSFKSMRLYEALENGLLFAPEPDAASTTEAVNYLRVLNMGPRSFANPGDFYLPAACLKGGSIDFSFGALTDVDANCTGLTCTIQPYVNLVLMDDVRLPTVVERKEASVSNGVSLTQEALYAFLGLADASTFTALAAGDFANVEISANGFSQRQLHVTALERAYHDEMMAGGFSQVHGEPRAATDDNPKVSNGTAIAAADARLSPVIWSPTGSKITRLAWHAAPGLEVKWSGTNATAYALATRFLPRSPQLAAQYTALVEQHLGVKVRSGDVKTLTKRAYSGPRAPYMPLTIKVG